MKTTIYYFSGTGNSLHISRTIAAKLGDTTLTDIRNLDGKPHEITDERIGIIFPIYAFGPPPIMVRFLQHISGCLASYVFAVCNCAGMQGNALRMVHDLLAQKNIVLNSSFNVIMPSNYIPFGGAKPEEVTRGILRKAELRIADIADSVTAGKNTKPDTSRFLPGFVSRLAYNFFNSGRAKAQKKFFVTSRCNGCGICEKVCPVKNIAMIDEKPKWGNQCELCLGCLQFCPREAIAFGKEYPNRKHYHHPDVTAADLFGGN